MPQPDALLIILYSLAIFRLARMVQREDGPRNMFGHLRGWVERRYGWASWQGRGMNCQLCIGVWVAVLLLPALLVPGGWIVLALLGCAGLQSLIVLCATKEVSHD